MTTEKKYTGIEREHSEGKVVFSRMRRVDQRDYRASSGVESKRQWEKAK